MRDKARRGPFHVKVTHLTASGRQMLESRQRIAALFCTVSRGGKALEDLLRSSIVSRFDRVSKMLEGKQAEIEVASLCLGGQVQAEWLPLHGIAYGHKDDLIEATLDGLDHIITKPHEIYVEDGTEGLESCFLPLVAPKTIRGHSFVSRGRAKYRWAK